jgi:hypothetical protein
MSAETSHRIDTAIITDTVAEGVIITTIEDEALIVDEDAIILPTIIINNNIILIVEEASKAEAEVRRRAGRPAIDFKPMCTSRIPNGPLCVNCNS